MIPQLMKRMAFVAVASMCFWHGAAAATNLAPANPFPLPQATQGDFQGSIDPLEQQLLPGGIATFTITVTSVNGFAGTVELSASQLPPGAAATFSPSTLLGSGTSTVTITTTRETPTRGYPVLLSGTSGSITHTGQVFLNVGPSGTKFGDFGGTVNPSYQTITPGATTSYNITVFPIDGFQSDVQLWVSGLPPEATATFSTNLIKSGSGATTLTVTTASSTPTATYHLLITAEGGGRKHTNGMLLNVGPPGTDFTDFGGTVSPPYQTVLPGGSTSYNVTVLPMSGFSSDVSLIVSGLPPGAAAIFTPSVIPGGNGASTPSITTAASTPTATYHLTVTGTGGGRTHTNGMNLNVGPAGTDFTDYTGSIAPQSLTILAGRNAMFKVSIQLFDGTGCVTLQASGIPPAAEGQFDGSSQICGSSGSTEFVIETSPQTPAGTYTIMFQGTTTGGFTHQGFVTLTIAPNLD